MATTLSKITRREALTRAGLLTGAAIAFGSGIKSRAADAPTNSTKSGRFIYCLNMATVRGQKLGIVKEVDTASKAGYQAIEPWISSLEDYKKQGGSMSDLKKRISDGGLTVESAIGFPQWIVDDEAKRKAGLEQAKREMELVAEIGGKRLACPPQGATTAPSLDLHQAAERYRALLEIGDQVGVVPQLELWGFSKHLHLLGDCAAVAIESGHPKACILIDVYHLYKGGTNVNGLALLNGNTIHGCHMNDYPADPPRDKITDAARVYPGDGIAPLTQILKTLHNIGGDKFLSLELFNNKYWAQDALETAKAGLEKMKASVEKAMAA